MDKRINSGEEEQSMSKSNGDSTNEKNSISG
jgi:hypothetical protein